MGIRSQWISEPVTPGRIAEAVARSFLAIVIYVVALYGVLVWGRVEIDWFAALGLLVPLFWLLEWVLPERTCSES